MVQTNPERPTGVVNTSDRLVYAYAVGDPLHSIHNAVSFVCHFGLRAVQLGDAIPSAQQHRRPDKKLLQPGLNLQILRQSGVNFTLDMRLAVDAQQIAERINFQAAQGPEFITVDASVGPEALRTAQLAAKAAGVKIVAYTFPPSRPAADIERVYGKTVNQKVIEFGEDVAAAGIWGIMASGHEMPGLRDHADPAVRSVVRIATGIHAPGYPPNPGVLRAMEPGEAIEAGADLIIKGRSFRGHDRDNVAAETLADIRAVERTLQQIT